MDFKQIQMVWMALVAGLAAYTVVAYGILTVGGLGVGALPPGLMPYAAAAAVVLMLAGLGLRRRLVSAIPGGVDASTRLTRYFSATLVGLALVEASGLLVITLSILADTPTWALAGGGAALFALVAARPRRGDAGLGPPTP